MNFLSTRSCCLSPVSTDSIQKLNLHDQTSIEYFEDLENDRVQPPIQKERKFNGLIKIINTKTIESISGLFKQGIPFGDFVYESPLGIYKGLIKLQLVYFESAEQSTPLKIDPLTRFWIDRIKNFEIILDGEGQLELESMTLTGRFTKGQPVGVFHVTFKDEASDLSEYQGRINASYELHGEGCLTLKDGSTYKGTYEHNKMKGWFNVKFTSHPLFSSYKGRIDKCGFSHEGKLVLEQGRVISAVFENDLTIGNVIMEDSADSSKYEGHLDSNFKKTGFGCVYKTNGTYYYGEFLNDEPVGNFLIYDTVNLTSYKGKIDTNYHKQGPFCLEKTIFTENESYILTITGLYFDDVPSEIFTINSKEFVYVGEVDLSLSPSGPGKISDNRGITLIGHFNDGLPIKGKIIPPSGRGEEDALEIEGQLALLNEYLRVKEFG